MTDGDDASFDLLAEPWILVTAEDGRSQEVSLREVFSQARQLRALGGDVPTQSFAVLRICLAILHRALLDLTPSTAEDAAVAVEKLAENWENVVVPKVLDYLDNHRDRFDLFHPTTPFLQTAGMHTSKGDVSELSKIVVDVPNGAPFLAMRSARDLRRMRAAEAARWVVHTQAYDPSGIKTGVVGHPRAKGGKVYPEGVAWTGQLGGLHLVAENLCSTMLLNLWAVPGAPYDEIVNDLAAWERPPLQVRNLAQMVDGLPPSRPSGPVDLYTWQPRCILLEGGPGGVTGVLLSNADRFLLQDRQDVAFMEPMTLWRYSKPQTAKYKRPIQMTSKHEPGAALWRGLASLLPAQSRGEQEAAPTALVQHAQHLRRSTLVKDELIQFRAISVQYGSNESVVDEIVDDSLDLPAVLLDPGHQGLRDVALRGVEAAYAGVGALRNLAANLAAAAGASGAALDGPRDRAREDGYAALDPVYRQWLRDTARRYSDHAGLADLEWQRTAWRTLSRLGDELVAAAPDKAWKGYGATSSRPDVGKVDVWFRAALAKAFPRARIKEPASSVRGKP